MFARGKSLDHESLRADLWRRPAGLEQPPQAGLLRIADDGYEMRASRRRHPLSHREPDMRRSLDETGNPIDGIGHQFAIGRRAEEHGVHGSLPVLAELPGIVLLAFSLGQEALFRAGQGGRAVHDQN